MNSTPLSARAFASSDADPARTDERRRFSNHARLLVAAGALVLLLGTFDHALWIPDEPRVAEIAREIGAGPSLFVPTLNGKPFLEKPPLYFWLTKAAMVVAGPDAVRLPSVLLAIGTALAALAAAARAFGARAGVAAFFLTAYSAQWLATGHRVIVDTALAFGVAVALVGVQWWTDPRHPRDRRIGVLAFHLGALFAFWSKGPVGLVFSYATLAGTILLTRQWGILRDLRLWIGGVLVALGSASWFLAVWQADPSGDLVLDSIQRNVL
ncbi:MAG: glycosyltransferase family 39 protein, partial [Planctomycetes bacterium]|nr:glycosyltransferase family 39 protein [Planctomycetota bacterium]